MRDEDTRVVPVEGLFEVVAFLIDRSAPSASVVLHRLDSEESSQRIHKRHRRTQVVGDSVPVFVVFVGGFTEDLKLRFRFNRVSSSTGPRRKGPALSFVVRASYPTGKISVDDTGEAVLITISNSRILRYSKLLAKVIFQDVLRQ